MTPDSIHGLSIPRELVLNVLRGEERLADVRRLRVLAALAQQEPQKDAA
jgi:hypothetical protein